MAPSETIKILISGGGIAGNCAAYWLSKAKINVEITVVERSPVPRVTGQAVDIRGRAIDIIDLMGLRQTILSKNTTETGLAFVDQKGNISSVFESDGDKSATSEFEILRADLAQIFMDACSDRSNIKFVYGTSIETLTQKDNNVSVTFTGGKKAEDYHVVLGADGSKSKTRRLAFDVSIAGDPFYYLGQYIGYFSIPRIPSDNKYWNWYNAPKGRAAMIRPHQNPETMGALLCVTTPSRLEKDTRLEKAIEEGPDAAKKVLAEYFEGAGWQSERIIKAMWESDDFYMNTWDQVRMPQWSTGNVALIGDAAVATPGAGTSYAIETGYLVAGELSKLENLDDIQQALQNYEKIFRPTVDQALPPGGMQLANPQTAWGIWIKNSIAWGIQKSGIYKLGMFAFGPNKPGWELPIYEWK